ncbi:MAG: pyridoxamine 5'-phosphate oxidase [Acidobacteria bacterium OLB17]|nr:MAG: pyridoxamine 5'-phosphate oxidase [Acidobacteria bacterium OLB17]MCZ2391496.1 pyridoxamine 5'-phosphate oxidase family protein [Acidobacteriota bacterium]
MYSAARKEFDDRDWATLSNAPSSASACPFEHFDRWFIDAVNAGVQQAGSMVLATATPAGEPSARIVTLHGLRPSGLTFITVSGSRKFREISENPKAALLFYWKELERQIRIEGTVTAIPNDDRLTHEAAEYERFESRGHIAKMFSERMDLWTKGESVDPISWQQFELRPATFEFWEGSADGGRTRTFYRRTSGERFTKEGS